MSTLSLEVVFTRIFSVTMGYHFAFLAISLALMGSAMAGVILYFFPQLTRPKQVQRWIGLAALTQAISIPLTFLLYLRIPLKASLDDAVLLQQSLWMALICVDLTLPFFASGLALSLAISAWSEKAGRVYWADLTGASLGCLLSIIALEGLGGAGAVLAVGVVAALAGLTFTLQLKRLKTLSLLIVMTLLGLILSKAQWNWITISASRSGVEEAHRLHEHWNAHSRVTVYEIAHYPFFWSVDINYWNKTIEEGRFLNHALLLIDAVAGTPIQEFRGYLNEVEFLHYDLTSFAYHLIKQPQTLVIGPGGGRDVLAALASGAPHVTAVEVNPAVIAAVRGPFADFSGHLYERPDVTVVVDDARGYITRSPERYDIIQASLIDTWASGGSGAFALSENSLYTVEAFRTYYDHLTDQGILTVSRWYLTERPAETLRLISTGLAGWASAGVADPQRCVAVVARPNLRGESEGMATTLFKRTPFTQLEVAVLKEKAEHLGFTVLYAPGLLGQDSSGEAQNEGQSELSHFITSENRRDFISTYPLDISPATDDRPFFFNLVRFGDFLDTNLSTSGVYRASVEAILILAAVLGATVGMGVLFILLPLWLGAKKRGLARPSGGLLAYFGMLGAAFMLIEIPTIQRLTVYLGRPIYSLAIVLFSILIFSGLGSLWAGRRSRARLSHLLRYLFPLLVATVILHATVGVWLLETTIGQPFTTRLAVTMALLAPLGFLMGIPFPLGMRWAGTHRPGVVPWLWGVNGTLSVLGSALSIALAIHVGLRATLLVSAGLYGLAGLLLVQETDREHRHQRTQE
jgi:hypothetical protein